MDSNKRPDSMERITTPELAQAFIDEQVRLVRDQVKDGKVLLALSGGVDSSVVAALLIKAIGSNLVCVHVNHGFLRKGESSDGNRRDDHEFFHSRFPFFFVCPPSRVITAHIIAYSKNPVVKQTLCSGSLPIFFNPSPSPPARRRFHSALKRWQCRRERV